MEKIHYDMIYLAACGVNGVRPKQKLLKELDMEKLYRMSYAHLLDALVGMTLKKADVSLPKEWTERISKAVRKNVLFDAEREKLLAYMEQKRIWYLPLKGIILKDYYPMVGMRQMSDNDILFDDRFCNEVRRYMESQGYECTSIGKGNHDVYQKAPVYNFELHRALYGAAHQNDWEAYYKDVKEKLILDSGSSYGYHFSDEDFYVYIVTHAYKHYIGSGTGLRTLLDFYVYLKAKEQEMDFAYIENECKVLGIAEFERKNRILCKKVFQTGEAKELEQQLSEEEWDMLKYYLSSGVYGTLERGIENRVNKFRTKGGRKSKLKYYWSRIFPDAKVIEKNYAFVSKHKFLLPFGYMYRLLLGLCDKDRRKRMQREIKIVTKM